MSVFINFYVYNSGEWILLCFYVNMLLGKCDGNFFKHRNKYWQWNAFLFGVSLGFLAYFIEDIDYEASMKE